ncbi:MAG TPA: ABC transporter permease [Thermomicrobiales bacterium]|jgi:molybdate transport system permease protein
MRRWDAADVAPTHEATATYQTAPHGSATVGLSTGVWLAAAALVLFLALPLLALVLRASEAPRLTEATRHTLRQALELTVVTTGISLAVILVLGTPLAYLLARRRFPGIHLVNTLIDLPMVLPPAVAGIALLMAFGRRGIAGKHLDDVGITLGFTTAAVVLAQIFVSVPFYVRAARAGFARVARDLEDAAADLGAPPARVFWSVTLPLARPSLAAGAVLAWARAVGEFGATIMFAGNFAGKTQTMPLAIYGRYEAGDLTTALLLSAVLLVASMLVLLAVRLVGGRAGDLTAS